LIDPTVFEKHQVGWGKEKKMKWAVVWSEKKTDQKESGQRQQGSTKSRTAIQLSGFFLIPSTSPSGPFFRVVPSTSH
jgi:hypothetical protein